MQIKITSEESNTLINLIKNSKIEAPDFDKVVLLSFHKKFSIFLQKTATKQATHIQTNLTGEINVSWRVYQIDQVILLI